MTSIYLWKDCYTTAEGWLVIDCIINGLSGGGVIMSPYLTQTIIENRAAHMTRKLSLCSPQIGGAKGGVRFPNTDPRAPFVLSRFLQHFQELLRDVWLFAGDFNSLQKYQNQEEALWIEEVYRSHLNLNHSQYALAKKYSHFHNHFHSSNFMNYISRSCSLRFSSLREATSGYGMAMSVASIKTFLLNNNQISQNHCNNNLYLPLVAIYGFDEATLNLAYYLESKNIAKVIAIADHSCAIFQEKGLLIQKILNEGTFKNTSKVESTKSYLNISSTISLASFYGSFSEEMKLNINYLEPSKVAYNFRENQIEEFFKVVPKFDILCACGTASRYQLTCKVTETMLRYQTPSAIVCGTNSPFGKLIHHPVECSRYEEDIEGEVINLLSSRSIHVIPDWVANIGRNQFYQLGATSEIDLTKADIENSILESCAAPITDFLHSAYQMYSTGNYSSIYNACEQLSNKKIREPISFRDCVKLVNTPTDVGEYQSSTKIMNLAQAVEKVLCLNNNNNNDNNNNENLIYNNTNYNNNNNDEQRYKSSFSKNNIPDLSQFQNACNYLIEFYRTSGVQLSVIDNLLASKEFWRYLSQKKCEQIK